MSEFDTAVLMGRFQPYHRGHEGLLRKAHDTAPRVVVVLGSAFAAPTPRNPFSSSEREAAIRATLDPETNSRTIFHHQRDVWDGERWARQVRNAVEALAPGRIALVGYHKDGTSSYLDTFPEWRLIDAGRQGPLDATPLRERILSTEPWEQVGRFLSDKVHPAVLARLSIWARAPLRHELAEDSRSIDAFRSGKGRGPFLSICALVRAQGHVLLLRRDTRPSRGTWAIPGGFLDPDERLVDGARRKLHEETGLSTGIWPTRREMIFSHPDRSQRGRIVNHVHLVEPDWEFLPGPPAGHARQTAWVPETSLAGMEPEFFEDHFHILDRMLGILP